MSAFSNPTVAPFAKALGCETSFVVETVTVMFPCATAAGRSFTSAPITTVPVLSFTTTLALSIVGETSRFSMIERKLTLSFINLAGISTLTELPSTA